MAHQESLQKLYMNELRDLMSAEHMILDALPKMADKATHAGLKDSFRLHEQQTRQHVDRLKKIFSMLGVQAKEKECKGMKGIIEEGQETMKEYDDADVLDAALIAAAQRVEHYEIAAYGCAHGVGESARAERRPLTPEAESRGGKGGRPEAVGAG
jgi:Uncharacterized protein conserved in bacteria